MELIKTFWNLNRKNKNLTFKDDKQTKLQVMGEMCLIAKQIIGSIDKEDKYFNTYNYYALADIKTKDGNISFISFPKTNFKNNDFKNYSKTNDQFSSNNNFKNHYKTNYQKTDYQNNNYQKTNYNNYRYRNNAYKYQNNNYRQNDLHQDKKAKPVARKMTFKI